MSGIYQPLPVCCTLSVVSMEECAIRMRPSRAYKLCVGRALLPYAYMLVKNIGADSQEHPFAPYINVLEHQKLQPLEWFIEGDTGDAWGSKGL
jgi:hypothetical protein